MEAINNSVVDKEKKYELTSDTIEVGGETLYRIKSLKAFSNVQIGELGGYVGSYDNLSHSGDAWVSGNARVSDDARVSGNAWVSDDARVYGRFDIFVISDVGSERGTFTAFRNKKREIICNRGCFNGTLEEFAEAVEETHENNFYGKEYKLIIDLARLHLSDNTKGD